ncbi:MAG: ArsR/SmtB family transcription factor [Trebonia sp.]
MSSEEVRAAGTGGNSGTGGPPELRKITDARTMRALAHPVRVAIIEELSFGAIQTGGGMTATELGEAIGETATTCSFHLRQLAKYGFVEEAGGGKGRARPWKMTSVGQLISPAPGDAEAQIASNALVRLFRDRQLARYQTWQETRAEYPEEWRNAATNSEYTFHVTPAELRQLNSDVHDLLFRFWERNEDPSKRPPGALPVETLLFNYPIVPPKATTPEDEGAGA